MPRGIVDWAGVLMFFLIAVVFYVGLTADLRTFANGAQQIIYALTGRTEAGRFPRGYPGVAV